jgi:hypothetical protein
VLAMPASLVKWTDHAWFLAQGLARIRANLRHSDFELRCRDRSFRVHKLVLAFYTDHFGAFDGPWARVDVNGAVMSCLLDFMYLGQAVIDYDRMEEFLQLCTLLKLRLFRQPMDWMIKYREAQLGMTLEEATTTNAQLAKKKLGKQGRKALEKLKALASEDSGHNRVIDQIKASKDPFSLGVPSTTLLATGDLSLREPPAKPTSASVSSSSEANREEQDQEQLPPYDECYELNDFNLLCRKCYKCFSDQKTMSTHSLYCLKAASWSCKFCSLKFRNKHVLDDHERAHTGEKPFE